jgi:hypothetical protein
MPNETDSPDAAKLQDVSTDAQTAVREKLKRIANRAAKRAGETGHRHDGQHGVFTK